MEGTPGGDAGGRAIPGREIFRCVPSGREFPARLLVDRGRELPARWIVVASFLLVDRGQEASWSRSSLGRELGCAPPGIVHVLLFVTSPEVPGTDKLFA